MKRKLVLRGKTGTEDTEQPVILAMELDATENKVHVHQYSPEAEALEALESSLQKDWANNPEAQLPEGSSSTEKTLSPTEPLLPEGTAVDNHDDLERHKTEWYVLVLSEKMFQAYSKELEELEEEIHPLQAYDKNAWEKMKSFWAKVQQQIRERNLSRDHGKSLRKRVDMLFDHLKSLRQRLNKAFEEKAEAQLSKLQEELAAVEKGIEEDESKKKLRQHFDQLKALQRKYHKAKLKRDDRNKFWNRMDKAFKEVKEQLFPNNSSAADRLENRISGLQKAIDRMQNSVNRDKKELDFQNKKIQSGKASQIEMQLREAKSKLFQERIDSKQEKLEDMHKTLKDLQKRLEKMKAKIAEKAAKEKAKQEAAAKKKAEEAAKAQKQAAQQEAKSESEAPAAEEKTEEPKEKTKTEAPAAEEKTEEPKEKTKTEAPAAEEKTEEPKEKTETEAPAAEEKTEGSEEKSESGEETDKKDDSKA